MKIQIIGSGFVGQATGKGLIKHGHDVRFIDTNPSRVKTLRADGFAAERPEDSSEITSEITFFSVPTPTVNNSLQFDCLVSSLKTFAKKLASHRDYHLIVIRSTVLPKTTQTLVIPLLESVSGKKVGRDFGVCMQPEFLRQANAQSDFDRPWLILIGQYDRQSGDLLEKVYQPFNAPIERVSLQEAEMQKYVHNLYNAVKIAFFNEMRLVCQKEGIEAETIFPMVAKSAEAIWNPLYGIKDKGPFDGACLPKDTQAFLDWGQSRDHVLHILGSVIWQNKQFAKRLQRIVPLEEAPHARISAHASE